jgi:transcriptional regulator with XRE-family HTH domain
MTLTLTESKPRLPYGKQREIAKRLGVAESYVSAVVNETFRPRSKRGWKMYRRVQVAVARSMGQRVEEVFPLRSTAA